MADVGIIALVPDAWDDPTRTTRHHVLSRLSRRFPIVWVDPSKPWRDYLQASSFRATPQPPYPAPSKLLVLRPSFRHARVYRPRWLGRHFERRRLANARKLLTAMGARRIVAYLWRPEFANALTLLRHDLSCYHIDDEYSFSTQEGQIDIDEHALIRAVDLVFIHSQAMLEKKGHLNPSTYLIPNGVDYAAFSARQPEPPDLAAIPRPRIGYVGVIKQQLDLGLALELARRKPGMSFVFVGPIGFVGNEQRAVDELRAQPNCYFLGAKPIEVLPGYMQHLDVGLLCYKVDGYTKYIYPLKLHEHLAAGVPVVASPIAALKPFAGVIALAGAADEWCAAIEQQLGAMDPSTIQLGQEIAKEHDWGRLVDRLASAVQARLADHEGRRTASSSMT